MDGAGRLFGRTGSGAAAAAAAAAPAAASKAAKAAKAAEAKAETKAEAKARARKQEEAAAKRHAELRPLLASTRGLPTNVDGPLPLNSEGKLQLQRALKRGDAGKVRLLMRASPSREVLLGFLSWLSAAEENADLLGLYKDMALWARDLMPTADVVAFWSPRGSRVEDGELECRIALSQRAEPTRTAPNAGKF